MTQLIQWLGALISGQADATSQTLFYLLVSLLAAAEWMSGYAMLRVQMGIGGALLGAVLGYAAGWRVLGLPLTFPAILPTLLLAAAGGAAGAWIAVRIYRFGVFCVAFAVGSCALLLFGAPLPLAVAIGAVLGALAAWLLRPAVVLLTAFGGAAVLLQSAPAVFGWSCPTVWCIGLTVALGLLGCFLQSRLAPPEPKRKATGKKKKK